METTPYVKLSALMFMEFAVWGAWLPVLAARLLGPLKMSGKQTGWIYATLPLASMFSMLFAGQIADKYVDARWILAFCHGLGVVLLFMAARITKFKPLFLVMLAYSFLYGASLPLVNSVLFTHVSDPVVQARVFIWAPIAWALIGYVLSGWRNLRKAEGDGSDCLKFAAILSIVMTLICLIQPATPPKGGEGVTKALSMLANPNFAVLIFVSLAVAGMMQFYFLGTARFLSDIGASGKNVPAIMGIAQAAQAGGDVLRAGFPARRQGARSEVDDCFGSDVLADPLRRLLPENAQGGHRGFASVPRTGLCVLHHRRPDLRQHDCAEGNCGIGPIADHAGHEWRRLIPRHAVGGHCHGSRLCDGEIQLEQDFHGAGDYHAGWGAGDGVFYEVRRAAALAARERKERGDLEKDFPALAVPWGCVI